MCVDLLPYTDTEFPVTKATREGVTQTQPLDPYKAHSGAEMFTCADMWYEQISTGKMAVKSLAGGAWTYIKGVDFGKGTEKLLITAKGMGVIELRLDDRNAEPLGVIELANDGFDKIPVVLLSATQNAKSGKQRDNPKFSGINQHKSDCYAVCCVSQVVFLTRC